MDKDEAAAMIKGLRQVGLESDQKQRSMERDARAARSRATKKAAQAMADPSKALPTPSALPSPDLNGGRRSSHEGSEAAGRAATTPALVDEELQHDLAA